MHSKIHGYRLISLLTCFSISLIACGRHNIKYKLDTDHIVVPEAKIPLKALVSIFSDKRDLIERQKLERKKQGFADIGDYTYDKNFSGEVDKGISKQIATHLSYAKIFSQVDLGSFRSEEITPAVLGKLAQDGIDAVLLGQINHFYGYFGVNPKFS